MIRAFSYIETVLSVVIIGIVATPIIIGFSQYNLNTSKNIASYKNMQEVSNKTLEIKNQLKGDELLNITSIDQLNLDDNYVYEYKVYNHNNVLIYSINNKITNLDNTNLNYESNILVTDIESQFYDKSYTLVINMFEKDGKLLFEDFVKVR